MIRLLSIAGFIAITTIVFTKINDMQPEPYMDEIFHIPQAQNYCHLHYDQWNDKITTLPGLYFASQIPLTIYSLGNFEKLKENCSAYFLRLTNIMFIIGCYFIFYEISRILRHHRNEAPSKLKGHTNALVLTFFPLLYFYSFMYYTDVGSTFFVFLCYYCSLLDCHITSAAVGCIAVLFRQTNIIWVGFSAATSIIQYLLNNGHIYKKSNNILVDIVDLVKGCLMYFLDIVKIAVPYILVLVAFVVFVITNNGIVVGDRSAHEASFNVPQMLYFAAFASVFASFLYTRYLSLKRITNAIKNMSLLKLILALVIIGVMIVAVHKLTYVHKYLISDNRHYPFYIWRKIINRHWAARYALIPIYFLSWCLISNELKAGTTNLWMLIFYACTFVTLVPQKLLEFRYFIVPFLLFRLHIRTPTYLELLIEFLLYSGINAGTIYLFIYKPFYWPSEESVQRFMW